jgi:hypothetical protein
MLSFCSDHIKHTGPDVESGLIVLGGAMLEEPIREGVPPKMKGSVLMCVADTEEEVMERVRRDVYYEAGVWDKEKVSSFCSFCLVLGIGRVWCGYHLGFWGWLGEIETLAGSCWKSWNYWELVEIENWGVVHTRFCVRLANRFTCAGSDLSLQERYQAGTLEMSIPFCGHESIEEYDLLHPNFFFWRELGLGFHHFDLGLGLLRLRQLLVFSHWVLTGTQRDPALSFLVELLPAALIIWLCGGINATKLLPPSDPGSEDDGNGCPTTLLVIFLVCPQREIHTARPYLSRSRPRLSQACHVVA